MNRARREANEAHPVKCPRCGSEHIRGDGTFKGVQRYSCGSCKKYFRETTGKMMYWLKKPELLPTYLYAMLMGYSIRKCAGHTGISIQTSFDWRHKILSAFEEAVPDGFEGIVESDDIFFLESSKGSRTLPRRARKRGGKATKPGISDEQIAVVVTCDRSDNKELRVATRGRIRKTDLSRILDGKLERAEILCSDAHPTYCAFANDRKIVHQTFAVKRGQRVKNQIYHVQNVNNTVQRLRQWMQPFHGVATKYLQNYLNWFMILERIKNRNERLQSFARFIFLGSHAWFAWKSLSLSGVA